MEELIGTIRRELTIDLPLRPETPLLSSGIIDSLRVAELLAVLGAKYGVAIDPSEVGVDNFDTAAQMYAFVKRP